MGRKKKTRKVQDEPRATHYKPQGIPMRMLQEVMLSVEGFEALRLADAEGLTQPKAAEQMDVSRPTFNRMLAEARKTVATALAKGWAIRIEGGDYDITGGSDMNNRCGRGNGRGMNCPAGTAPGQGRGQGRGQGMGRGQGQGLGQGMGRGQGMGQGRGMGGGGNLRRRDGSCVSGAQTGRTTTTDTTGKDTLMNIDPNSKNIVAISCEGPSLDEQVDPRFGRAAGFLLVDTETMKTDYIDNGGSQVMSQGAGIQAAETVANSGATTVLTGFVGPKAFTALEAAGVKIGQDLNGLSARDAVQRFKDGQVPLATSANQGAGANKG